MKWNVEMTSEKGKFILSEYGFRTKQETQQQAAQANQIRGIYAKVVKQ